jgi:hypothetical protein
MRRALLILVGLIVLVGVIALAVYITRNEPPFTNVTGALSAEVGKPKPIADYYNGCPPSGDGGDPVLNTLKNRVDEGQWQATDIASILSLTWPEEIEGRPRSRWSAADKENIAQHEGTPIQVEGYLTSVKKMSPETCNCHSVKDVDFHLWLVDDRNKDRTQSVVIETTPRVMTYHPEWTLSNLREIVTDREKVRISGWLLMDPEHPDQIGKTRGTIWEIHPVMQIEVQRFGKWTPLDNGTTGISSAPSVAQTAPPVTPDSTATMPPPSNTTVQDNTSVKITSISYDGTKGSNEPDEYVEISNTGREPVDITDWELQDTSGSKEYRWESYTIQPGAAIRVYTNEVHSDTGGFSFQSGRALWANSGDVAELYDADKQLISRYAYGNKR